MDKEKVKKVDKDDKVNLTCVPPDNTREPNRAKDRPGLEASNKAFRDPKLENTATDVYYNTECKLPESEVAIPTYDAVLEAKEWVDQENKK